MNNLEKLKQIINEILEDNDLETPEEISLNSRLKEDIGFDSFNLALLTVKIEDECGVDIFENSFPKTVGDIIDLIEV